MHYPTVHPLLDPRTRATLEAELAEASRNPELCPLMERGPDPWPGLVSGYLHLTRLPRKLRRQLQRRWKRSLAGLAAAPGPGPGRLAAGERPSTSMATDLLPHRGHPRRQCRRSHGDCPAGSGADTLNLGAGSTHTLTAVNNDAYGDNGLPVVSSPITIEGNGSTITRDSGAPAFRIFTINSAGNLTLNETTVSGGVAGDIGGGVFNYAGTATLTHSTVSGNSAGYGGGVVNVDGTTTLTNSTVSGNRADTRGGGVLNNYGFIVIEHSTLTGNTAPANEGGGVAIYGGSGTLTRVRASLIAANTDTDVDFTNGVTNSFDSDGDNLIGDGNATGNFNQGGDQTGVADPGLGPLADNGGPTETHAPMAGSPTIDAVTGTCPPPADDQRGVARPQGPACDIGSVEVMAAPSPDLAVSKTDSPDPVAVGDLLSYTVTVNNAGVGDATGVTLTDTLPTEVDFVSATPSQGSCGEAGLVVTCDLGDLGSGASATVTIVVQPTATGTITNSVTVESAETDENLDNNTDTEETTVAAFLCDGLVPTIVGTNHSEIITGTLGPDVIVARGGNDVVFGLSGHDLICGGSGHDVLFGDSAHDKLFGHDGNDTMSGGFGNDACNGGPGFDAAIGCETKVSVP